MAQPIPLVLDELLAILKEVEATLAWRKLEKEEHPRSTTPMGALSDDSLEDLDTLIARFVLLYDEIRRRLLNPRLCGMAAGESDVYRARVEKIREAFLSLMLACPGRSSCRR